MRAVRLPGGTEVILSDTVGFISDLPPQLVAAFRATLEEVVAADLVLHVRDISHPETEEQAQDVQEVLEHLGMADDIPVLELWNKIDLVPSEQRQALETAAARMESALVVSAIRGTGLDQLERDIARALDDERTGADLTLRFDEGRARAWLFDQGVVTGELQDADAWRIHVMWTARQRRRFADVRGA